MCSRGTIRTESGHDPCTNRQKSLSRTLDLQGFHVIDITNEEENWVEFRNIKQNNQQPIHN